jgi:vancomycin permeability regulator SanA
MLNIFIIGFLCNMVSDVGIILAHELKEDNSLSKVTRERVERGVALWKEGTIRYLIMTGDHHLKGQRYGTSLAKAMKNYAVKQGVNAESIIEEDVDLDTVGNLLFSKIGVVDPRGWKCVLVITHNYHGPRVKEIAHKVFGDGYSLDYSLVNSGGLEDEDTSMELFRETFSGIENGDSNTILERLFGKHGIYNSDPGFFRKRLDELAEQQSNLSSK